MAKPRTKTSEPFSCRLHQLASVGHRLVDRGEHDGATFILETKREHFRFQRPDLARREVYDRHNLTTDQLLGRIMNGDLGRGFLDPQLRSEIDEHYDRRLAPILHFACGLR